MVTSPVLECIIAIDILSKRQNLHTGSPNYGMRAIMVGKTKWKSLELSLPRQKLTRSNIAFMEELQGLLSART